MSLMSRRLFAVNQELARTAGGEVIMLHNVGPLGYDEPYLRDHTRATALGDFGLTMLTLCAGSAASYGDNKKLATLERKFYKALKPKNGLRASVFLSSAMAAIFEQSSLLPDSPFDHGRQVEIRALLSRTFPSIASELALIESCVAKIADDPLSVLPKIELCQHAVTSVMGQSAALLPGFAAAHGGRVESLVVDAHWKICWNECSALYLEFADPSGFAIWQSWLPD